jgi:hypothetical protein
MRVFTRNRQPTSDCSPRPSASSQPPYRLDHHRDPEITNFVRSNHDRHGHNSTTAAEANALFIAVPPEHFFAYGASPGDMPALGIRETFPMGAE